MFVENNLHTNPQTAVVWTECTPKALRFQAAVRRTVLAHLDAGTLTSDGGAVPSLRGVERVIDIPHGFAACFFDGRDPARVRHPVAALVRQRDCELALGYEDLNAHDRLTRWQAARGIP